MSAQRTGRFRSRQPDPKYMTFVEHLQELRKRLIVSLSSIAGGSVVGWLLASRVIRLLDEPLKQPLKGYDGKLIWQGPVDEIDRTNNAHVDQFIHGRAEGPIQMQVRKL